MQKLPQLTLRDLFWLVLVCALMVAWFAERHRSELLEQNRLDGEGARLLINAQARRLGDKTRAYWKNSQIYLSSSDEIRAKVDLDDSR
jgi:hypothetical protein